MKKIRPKERVRYGKSVWGWAIYDWANSAFATTVMAGFFPIFFKQYWSAGTDVNLSTAQLGFGNSAASLFVAFMAPVLGAVADKGSTKKRFLLFFALLGIVMTATLFWVEKGEWFSAICVYALGIVGFSGANVFYDSLLPDVAGEDRIDAVSSLGFSLGYLGGGLLFLINVIMTLTPETFGLADARVAVRVSFLSVALWWAVFSLFTLFWVPEARQAKPGQKTAAIPAGFRQLLSTFRKVRHLRWVFLFLLAYFFYMDGVSTIIRMAVDYGLSLGFGKNELILALLIVQFVGFPAALAFGRFSRIFGVRRSIYLAILVYIAITLGGTMMQSPRDFYLLAAMIGLVQGGIQALSRSYYSRLIPWDKSGEFYGFFNMLGKFAAILGPALMGGVGLMVRQLLMPSSPGEQELIEIGQLAARWSLGSVVLLFLVGGVLFFFVDEAKGREQVVYLSAETDTS